MKTAGKLVLAGMALAVTAAPAAAAIKIATFRGTIYRGTDATGVFGAAGQELGGQTYVTTYKYDRSLGGAQQSGGQFVYDLSQGGTYHGYGLSPIIDSTVTINGVTRHVAGSYDGFLYLGLQYQGGGTPGAQYSAEDHFDDGIISRDGYIQNIGVIFGLTSLDANVAPTKIIAPRGGFSLFEYNYSTGETSMSVTANFGSDDPIDFSVSDATGSTVPEPASWALLIAGFGLTGVTLRRTRSVRLA